jgi:hypothetical protein
MTGDIGAHLLRPVPLDHGVLKLLVGYAVLLEDEAMAANSDVHGLCCFTSCGDDARSSGVASTETPVIHGLRIVMTRWFRDQPRSRP